MYCKTEEARFVLPELKWILVLGLIVSCGQSSTQTEEVCGDSILDQGQTCDDGNVAGGDGCSASCQVEAGFSCVGEPSTCDATPVGAEDSFTTTEDVALTISVDSLLANDSDPELGSLSVLDVLNPVNGLVALSGSDIIFTPALNTDGVGSFEYVVSDGIGSATALVQISIIADADVPLLTANAAGDEDTTIPLNMLSSLADTDGSESLSVVIENIPVDVTPSAGSLQAFSTGGFNPIRDFAVGVGPRAIAVGRFNGDALDDVTVINQTSDNVSILLGDGNGGFQPATNVATVESPTAIAVGRFNGDAFDDLSIGHGLGGINILLGDGNGGFTSGPGATIGGLSAARSISVGRFNNDNIDDLAITASSLDSIIILLGNGNGTFNGPTSFATGDSPYSAAVRDLNGDTFEDLAVANRGSDNVSILLGDGNGGFAAAATFAAGDAPTSITAGDLNGDAFEDLAVANESSDNVSILLGDGDGGFTAGPTIVAGDRPSSVTRAKFNNDAFEDLAVVNFGSNNVSILLGDGNGGFTAGPNLAAGTSPISGTVGMFDAGSFDDLVVANSASDNVSTFTQTSVQTATLTAAELSGFTLAPPADFNGVIDLIATATATEAANGDSVSVVTNFSVTVQAVNDGPANKVPLTPQRAFLQIPRTFSALNKDPISISDVDAGTTPVRVVLSLSEGTITLSGTTGLTFTGGDGASDATMTFTGTLADINAALDGMSVIAGSEFLGTMALTITTDDLGYSGIGGALSDSDTVLITPEPGVFTRIAAGSVHSCGLTPDGTVFCWGDNANGQLGNGGASASSQTPTQVVGVGGTGFLSNVTQISAGDRHTCALLATRNVLCWGKELGGGGSSGNSLTPTQVVGVGGTGLLSDVTQISAGDTHTCAATSNGGAVCWGSDSNGRLGNNTGGSSQAPTQVVGVGGTGFLSNVVRIAAGSDFSCAVTGNSSAFCWGGDASGQLGNGASSADSQTPTQVLGGAQGGTNLSNVTEISAGDIHACAVTNNGSAFCWGNDAGGQLGSGGASTNSAEPTQVLGVGGAGFLSNVTRISGGDLHTCASTSDGNVFCWGDDTNGRLGNDTQGSSQAPTQVVGVGGAGALSHAVRITVGGAHSCAIASDGNTVCWGSDSAGQIGAGGASADSQTPIQALTPGFRSDTLPFTQISAGALHSCGLTSTGRVFCWGSDGSGRLGNGGGGSSQTPTQVAGVGGAGFLSNVTQISTGTTHTCASTSDGSAFCWGGDASGELGNGASSAGSQTPTQVLGGAQGGTNLSNVTQISAADTHTCAVTSDGSAFCWGSDLGAKLGNGAGTDSQLPTQVVGVDGAGFLFNVKLIAAGAYHSCAATGAGNVFCWGTYNLLGSGDSGVLPSETPIQTIISNVTSIDAGTTHTCATVGDGTGSCWGSDSDERRGNGSGLGSPLYPTDVLYLDGSSQISAGDAHGCAVYYHDYASLACWGSDAEGQIGDVSAVPNHSSAWAIPIFNITQVSAGHVHTCAIRSDGRAFCWGSDGSGQMGNGSAGDSQTPISVNAPAVFSEM